MNASVLYEIKEWALVGHYMGNSQSERDLQFWAWEVVHTMQNKLLLKKGMDWIIKLNMLASKGLN